MKTGVKKVSFSKIILFTAIVICVIIGITGIAASLIPFETAQLKMNAFSADGNAERFSAETYKTITQRTRWLGVGFLLTGIIFLSLKRKIRDLLSDFFISARQTTEEGGKKFLSGIKNETQTHLITVTLLIAVSIAIRIYFLFQPIRYDEAFTFTHFASKPLIIALSSYTFPNNHLFHTFFVRIAYLIFGNEVWVLRLPAFLSGLLLVPISYLTLRRLYNKYAAILGMALIAAWPFLIKFSVYARGYSLITLFFLLLILLGGYLRQNRNPFIWFLFSVIAALGFYTIPVMVYPYGIVMTWLLLHVLYKDVYQPAKHFIQDFTVSFAGTVFLTLLLYSPVLATSGLKSIISNPFVVSLNMTEFITQFPQSMGLTWHYWNRDIPLIILSIIVIGFFFSHGFYRQLYRNRILLIFPTLLFLLPLLIIQKAVPYPRVWLFYLPLYLGIASSGIVFLIQKLLFKNKRIAHLFLYTLAIAFALGMSIRVTQIRSVCHSDDRGTLRNAEEISLFLETYLKPNDLVLAYSPYDAPLVYYCNKHGFHVNTYYRPNVTFDRWLLVVNEPVQTYEEVFEKNRIPEELRRIPRLIKRFTFTGLYEIQIMENQ